MVTKDIPSRVLRVEKLTPTVLSIKFEPRVKFSFSPGQFITLAIPRKEKGLAPIRRSFSLCTTYEEALATGYRIIVKLVKGGIASEFLELLKAGDIVLVSGPFGSLSYRVPQPDRNVCFISSGTGISPIRAMVGSTEFQQSPNRNVTLLSGVRNESEILFPFYFESKGINVTHCVSRPENLKKGFWGRVTEYLQTRAEFDWKNTDFYVVGNERMVEAVTYFLRNKKHVPDSNIITEKTAGTLSPANVISFPMRAKTSGWKKIA